MLRVPSPRLVSTVGGAIEQGVFVKLYAYSMKYSKVDLTVLQLFHLLLDALSLLSNYIMAILFLSE